MRIAPDSQVFRAYAAFRRYACGFGHDQASPSYSTAPQVDQVPVARETVRAGVFTHWRNANAVGQCDASNWKWIENERHVFPYEISGIVQIAIVSVNL